jgi:hypothetical protein
MMVLTMRGKGFCWIAGPNPVAQLNRPTIARLDQRRGRLCYGSQPESVEETGSGFRRVDVKMRSEFGF